MARHREGLEALSGLRLNDFADASLRLGSSRPGKAASGRRPALRREALDWWELEEADLAEEAAPESGEDEEEQAADPRRTRTKGARRRRRRLAEESRRDAESWPVDLWHTLAARIPPEDIWRFASIAPVTRDIVHRVSFWKDTYWRHYSSRVKLPVCLSAANATSRLYGLRTRVIQALFYLYRPFVQRVQVAPGIQLRESALRQLSLGRLESLWSQAAGTGWAFFFKFQLRDHERPPAAFVSASEDIERRLKYLDNIQHNNEQGFCILKVTCKKYANLSSRQIGWVLSEIAFPLALDLMSHKIRLTFQSVAGRVKDADGGSKPMGKTGAVTLSGIGGVSLLHWWNPDYPIATL